MSDDRNKGVRHVYTDDQLRAYRRLTAEQKLQWLEAAWRLTVDFLPKDKVETYQRFRAGRV